MLHRSVKLALCTCTVALYGNRTPSQISYCNVHLILIGKARGKAWLADLLITFHQGPARAKHSENPQR